MDTETRLDLIKQVGEEIITEDDLRELLQTKSKIIAYDGFEPSGNIHIAQGVMRVININKMVKAGCEFKVWVADWFALMNDKLGGDLEKIRTAGEYMVEVWKASGLTDSNKVKFLWANDVMNDTEYWKKVINIARNSTVNRVIRCAQIMGRQESENLSSAQIFYPCMQAADIFHLEADIAQLGLDQRKVNMLAREVGPKLGFWKPVAVHHHMLMGLGEPPKGDSSIEKKIEMKMSKSVPSSAIFMTDTTEEIRGKIAKAYCPAKEVAENPILEYCKYIIFERTKEFTIERPSKFGGPVVFTSYDQLEASYRSGAIHPLDLKNAASSHIDMILKPVRDHFEKNKKAKDLLNKVKNYTITR